MTSTIPTFVTDELEQLNIHLSTAMLEQLARYLALLLEVNQQFNLTAIKDTDTAWRRHIIDSLTLWPLLHDLQQVAGQGAKLMDVGSGGGLPGVVLAVALPQVQVTLLEATGKKAKFLQRCVSELALANTQVVHERAERVGHDRDHRQKYDRVVCRAVGPMRELLEYTLPLVKVGGQLLAMKGAQVERELDAAGDALMLLGAGELELLQAYPDGWPIDAAIVRISKEHDTPRQYPRLPGVPRMEPL